MKYAASLSVLILGCSLFCAQGALAQAFNPPKQAPWGLPADNKIYAQKLVNDIMAANPDLYQVGLHAVPPGVAAKPGEVGQIMIAQVVQRIGAPDGLSDLEVTKAEQFRIYKAVLDNKQQVMRVMAPLRDASGNVLGLAVLLFYQRPDMTPLVAHTRAQAILDALAKKLPDQAALFKPAS